MPAISFAVTHEDNKTLARRAILRTPHGEIETPSFVTVGTLASVRTLAPDEIRKAGSQVVLANTYHLFLEGRHEVVKAAGGLSRFMAWDGPTMTDSGGYQVFSYGFGEDHGIGKNVSFFPGNVSENDPTSDISRTEKEAPRNLKITEEGVSFFSPRNGDRIDFTPELSMKLQEDIGADMFFAFDECTSPLSSYEYTKKAVDLTARWAKRCVDAKTREDQALFGIIQGGAWEDLRAQSVAEISALPFEGFGLGGPVGLTHEDIPKVVRWMTGALPKEKPRHLLGMGTPWEIVNVIGEGVDLFDCVAPTREARNGTLYTRNGKMRILNQEFRTDFSPIDEECGCAACRTFSRAYIYHLLRAGEILGKRLATIHNLFYINELVADCREAIKNGSYAEFVREFSAGPYRKELEGAVV